MEMSEIRTAEIDSMSSLTATLEQKEYSKPQQIPSFLYPSPMHSICLRVRIDKRYKDVI